MADVHRLRGGCARLSGPVLATQVPGRSHGRARGAVRLRRDRHRAVAGGAVHRPARVAVSFLAAALPAFGGFVTVRPEPTVSVAWVLAFGVTGYCVAVAWGMVVRSRRELVAS